MDEDIDYNELFGVGGPEDHQDDRSAEPNDVPLGGQGQDGGQTQSPAQEENVSDSDTAGAGDVGMAGVSDSDTSVPGQEKGQESGTVSDSGTAPGQGSEAGGDRHSAGEPLAAQPNDRSGSIPAASDQARAQYEAVIARAQADAQRAIDEAFKASGLKNPYTGRPITSKAEYDAYKERFDAERREQLMKGAGMSGEEFDRFVQDLPEVRRAREAQEAAERAQREAREAAARVKLDEQLREISAIDPSVKSLADLAKMPTYPRFYELVQRGNTLTDAFRLANFDALAQRSAAGARQAAVNAARSKEHLEQTKTRGTGAVSVPADVREQYKLFNPDATEEEIQKHYQKNHKEG